MSPELTRQVTDKGFIVPGFLLTPVRTWKGTGRLKLGGNGGAGVCRLVQEWRKRLKAL